MASIVLRRIVWQVILRRYAIVHVDVVAHAVIDIRQIHIVRASRNHAASMHTQRP